MDTNNPAELRIVEGAEELFSRYGLKSVTMDDIARHVGMSKKTLYQHFTDKTQIIQAVMKTTMHRQEECMLEFQKTAKDPVQEMVMMMQFLEKTFRRYNPNLFYDMQKHHPEVWNMFREFKVTCALENIINNIERGKAQGLYRKNVNSKILGLIRLEEVEFAMDPAIFPPDKFTITDVQIQMLEHFLHGICTLRGHRLVNKYLQIHDEE
jgi:TetR/AcrR family transcriptional regulator, cholesterol catabolism regulator